MKKLIALTVICLINVCDFKAQTNKGDFEADFNSAEEIFAKYYKKGKSESMSFIKGGYTDAIPIFLKLYKQDSTNANLAFKLGVCYQSSRTKREECIYYFSKAVVSASPDYKESSYKEKKAPLITYEFLGDAYHLNYEFDKAIEAYNKYISIMAQDKKTDKDLLAETKQKIEMCKTAKQLVANPINIKVENLGDMVNSAYGDYSPVLTGDQKTIFFTSKRLETKGKLTDEDGNNMEDVFSSTKTATGWSPAINVGYPINTDRNEATVGISPDGQTILIYKDELGDGNIYTTTLNGDRWSTPVKLNGNINSKYWEPSAFISADGSTLYFTSDRPGGLGGRDLYMSKRKQGGDWEAAVNMGPLINTIYDEDAPFIHPDGVSLSFSSNGHNTIGGFDIFTSVLSPDGKWSVPENVGFPINTTEDDMYYVVSPDNRTAYFSSFRSGGFGEKDNYVATFPDRRETPLTMVKGTVVNQLGKPAKNVEITVTDNETEQVIGVYKANSKTGQFLFILTPGRNYNITYQADEHLFYSENMEIPKESIYSEKNKTISLDPIKVGSKIVLNNIFFEFDKTALHSNSNVELKNLASLLKGNLNMKVEISGYTDNRGRDAYNQKLSEDRAMAVVNSLKASNANAMQMKAKGYGKLMPIALNKKADGSDDPDGRQMNRRVELKITEVGKTDPLKDVSRNISKE